MHSSLSLTHEFNYRTAIAGPHEVGDGPYGVRQYYEMTDGVLDGPRLTGRTIGNGSDWMLVGSDGFFRMDVRIQIMTHDGAIISARYRGPAEANANLRDALAANEPTEFKDQRIRTQWLLEAGDPRYAWVNQNVYVGEGRSCPPRPGVAGFEHRVYRVG